MQESRLYTGIPKWRERLGIEPSSRFSTGTTVLKTAAGTSRAIIPHNKLWTIQADLTPYIQDHTYLLPAPLPLPLLPGYRNVKHVPHVVAYLQMGLQQFPH